MVDLAPTILDFAGIDVPQAMEGISHRTLIEGNKKKIRKAFIIENRAVQKDFYQKMFVTDRYKLVFYYGHSYGELYDLSIDPDQYKNLWENPEYFDIKRQMLYDMYRKNILEGKTGKTKYTVEELLELLNKQIEDEGTVQKRTSFS